MAITAIAFGIALAHSVVPSSGSSAMSIFWPVPASDLLADIEHRRLVALALADHHQPVHVGDLVQRLAHGIDRRLVGRLLVAAPGKPRRRDRRRLGDPRDLDGEASV